MTINLTQIRSDFDNGIIVSKQTLLALVDYAIELEKKQPIEWTPGANEWKDWCTHYFGPDADETYLAEAVFNLPLMGQRFKRSVAPSNLAQSVYLLEQVMRPYGIYDVAVSNAGALQLDFIQIGNDMRKLISSEKG